MEWESTIRETEIYKVDRLKDIAIGYQLEHYATDVRIDVRKWLEKWPGAIINLIITRPGEEESYPAETNIIDGVMHWPVSRYDTEYSGNDGMMLIQAISQGREAASNTARLSVLERGAFQITEDIEIPGPPWAHEVLGAANRAEEAAERAEEAAERAEDGGSSGGATGADGKSAYEIAVENGFEGTITEWLASLKGEKGDKGDPGEPGSGGTGGGAPGADGKSAYEIAVENGFVGDIDAWIASLKGDKGDKGDTGSVGANGKSAYQIAVDNGFSGSVQAWIASLKGDTGSAGAAGYSPVRGVDYWTSADIETMKDQVAAALAPRLMTQQQYDALSDKSGTIYII